MTTLKEAYIEICYEKLDNYKRDMLESFENKNLVDLYRKKIEALEKEINEIIIDKGEDVTV